MSSTTRAALAAALLVGLAAPGVGLAQAGDDRTRPRDTAAPEPEPATAELPSLLDQPRSKEDWPQELVRRPLTLAPGMLELTLPVNANLSDGAVGEPVFLNPSLYYGVTQGLTVGVRHFLGLCVTGGDHGCPKVYNDVGIDTIWSLGQGDTWDFALGAALNATRFDPFTLSAEGRLAARWRLYPLAVTVAPQLDVGLTERDTGVATIAGGGGGVGGGAGATGLGNREVLTIPVTVQLQATRQLAVSVGVALSGPLSTAGDLGFGDLYTIPVAAGVDYALTSMLDLGAAFSFSNLLGKDGSADDRFGKVFARIRL